MDTAQVRRYLNQKVKYGLPTGEIREFILEGRILRKDRRTGDLKYFAELLDIKSNRSHLQVALEDVRVN